MSLGKKSLIISPIFEEHIAGTRRAVNKIVFLSTVYLDYRLPFFRFRPSQYTSIPYHIFLKNEEKFLSDKFSIYLERLLPSQ